MENLSSGYYWVIIYTEDGWTILEYDEDVGLFYLNFGAHSFAPSDLIKIGSKIENPESTI